MEPARKRAASPFERMRLKMSDLSGVEIGLRPKAFPARSIAMGHLLSTVAGASGHGRRGRIDSDIAAVLIVEAEVLIRMNVVQIVEDSGYAALEASNAGDAIKILKHRQDIRAVFTDVNISSSGSGLKLVHAIRRRWPPIHLIVTSGLSTDLELPPGSRFIRKPYENSRVVGVLHELLDAD
jgi:two-component system, response regulator PdtaR